MLFNSIEFLVFLPTVFLLYWLVLKERRWQNLLIVAASYLFYGWWDWRFLILIAFTSFCSFLSGLCSKVEVEVDTLSTECLEVVLPTKSEES